MTGAVEIVVRGLPLDLHARAMAHVDAVERELELVLRDADERRDVDQEAAAILATMQDLVRWFDDIGAQTDHDLSSARESGETSVDLCFVAQVDVADQARDLLRRLEESDGHSREGLLTFATPPDVRSFGEWILTECIRQSDGLGPRPWSTVAVAMPAPSNEPDDASSATGGGDDHQADRFSGDRADGDADLAGESDADGWDVSTDGSTVSIRFSGELDLVSSPHLRTLVANATMSADLSDLVVDLSDVSFIDSVGLSVLLTVRMRMVTDDVTITVIPSAAVDRVFSFAGVSELFVV